MPIELRRARYLAYVDQLQAQYEEHLAECGCERQTRWLGMLLGGARRVVASWSFQEYLPRGARAGRE